MLIEFHYFEQFQLTEIKTFIDYLNNEQNQHGRIIEIDADEIQKVLILRRIKFDNSKQVFRVKNVCNKKVSHHLKIADCDYALNFDLAKKENYQKN